MIQIKWLSESVATLDKADVESARLDCLLFLEKVLKRDRAYLLAHSEIKLAPTLLKKLDSYVNRRSKHEPIAYILGSAEFYGRTYKINKNVLVPRPESEDIINLLKDINSTPSTILDLGTGSGCLAITAKIELPKAEVIGTDIDNDALSLARQNAITLNSDVKFFDINLLAKLPISDYEKPITILANLPYVPDEYELNLAAKYEPKIALFGGPDGLDLYRGLFQSLGSNKRVHYVLTESLESQHSRLIKMAAESDYSLQNTQGLIQLFGSNN